MRWIFFVLVGANLLLLGWNLVVPDEPASAPLPPSPPADAPSIALLTEVEPEQAAAPIPAPESEAAAGLPSPPGVGQAERQVEDAQGRALCTFVGPFEAKVAAEQVVERLAAMGVSGRVAEVEIPTGPGYWVYEEPQGSRREALRRLAELQGQGIDSYMIPRGTLEHGISLGMFSRQRLAHERVKQMAEMGIDAQIEVIERSYEEIWVTLPVTSARQLGDQAWVRLLSGNENAERRQNFCLYVASQDNFH